MNKKIEKTIAAIYLGLEESLKEKPYAEITVQDILDKSHVSRSTFYVHFKDKDELLISVCSHVLEHVFSHTLEAEKTHDFSKSSIFDYGHLITHFFYHMRDERDLIDVIFKSEGKDIFIAYLKKQLEEFASVCVISDLLTKKDIPHDLRVNQFINNFVITLEYWQKNNYLESPEKLTEYFIKLN